MAKKYNCKTCGCKVIDTQPDPNELCTDCDDMLMHIEAKGREATEPELMRSLIEPVIDEVYNLLTAEQPDLFLEVAT